MLIIDKTCDKISNELLQAERGLFLWSREDPMKVCYDKLWLMMLGNQMKKSELAKAAKISTYTMRKLNHDLPVSMEVMMNLCKVFHCDIGDLMEVIEEY